MAKRILIVEGHPDRRPERLGRALADAYAAGATSAGHAVRRLAVADLALPFLATREEWEAEAPEAVRAAQADIAWAEHLVILYPLWLGDMPAMLKAFFEQVLRPGFALDPARGLRAGLLAGRSARVIVTMGMPALFYRLYFRALSLRMLRRNILAFCGIGPIRSTVIGTVESGGEPRHRALIESARRLGTEAG